MESVYCPLCGADDTRLMFKTEDYLYKTSEEKFRIVRCRRCRLVYVNPRPDADEIHAYYPPDFYQTTITKEQLLKEKERQNLLKYKYVSDMLPGRMLDIGPSKGEFMYFMQQKGWDVCGLEFSQKPPNVFDLDIYCGELRDANYVPESFDLITMWGVLEHVYEPLCMLRDAYCLLKCGGRFTALVTNFNSLPARLMRHDDVPRHTTLFTKRTMRSMLLKSGFEPERFYFNSELFGGTHRGVFNYLVKLAMGEQIDNIVSQNRSTDRWYQFSSQIRGKQSSVMLKVDRLDIAVTPYLDRIMDWCGDGFIMICQAIKG